MNLGAVVRNVSALAIWGVTLAAVVLAGANERRPHRRARRLRRKEAPPCPPSA